MRLIRDTEFRWIIPQSGPMRVPGVVFAAEALLPALQGDQSLQQVVNVATLPGIVRASFAMPDIHWGYGFPIGGVAATDVDADGVVSPGGVGFDISCGVRLLVSRLSAAEVRRRIPALMEELYRRVPAGHGGGGIWHLAGRRELERVLREGARAAVAAGFGVEEDIARCEDHGALTIEKPAEVSERALERGRGQLGSLGSGNHFLEVQEVERVFDVRVARTFGLEEGQAAVMIHSGSRGLGHQVCSDHVGRMLKAMERYGIRLPDRQLASVPVRSPEGQAYLTAMTAAANFGRANRQVMSAAVRDAFEAVLGDRDLRLVYDVSHNLAKIEEHEIDGRRRTLCVHRKGATRALPAGHPDLPDEYRDVGQPVLVPGSMGTPSYVLVGEPAGEAFHSTCHGSGRVMSRHQAMKRDTGQALTERLRRQGIHVVARAMRALPEEMPEAYKDVDVVVATCEGAGLSRPVARLRPMGVLKG
ncbi:MAG TPA: RtcB family protein [Candidatus Dormibacteraeota bacterium]|nr:RtcB family protein [Candidatus Dormibacteraeota bacterium]